MNYILEIFTRLSALIKPMDSKPSLENQISINSYNQSNSVAKQIHNALKDLKEPFEEDISESILAYIKTLPRLADAEEYTEVLLGLPCPMTPWVALTINGQSFFIVNINEKNEFIRKFGQNTEIGFQPYGNGEKQVTVVQKNEFKS